MIRFEQGDSASNSGASIDRWPADCAGHLVAGPLGPPFARRSSGAASRERTSVGYRRAGKVPARSRASSLQEGRNGRRTKMGAMTRVMLAAAVAVMMPAVSNAAVLWDFDTETGVSIGYSSGQGITAESHDLVSSPKTQGTSAARVQIDKNPGSMPSVSYRVART